MSTLLVISQIAWWAAVLPLAAYVLVSVRDRQQPSLESLLLAVGFALSWVMDAAAILSLRAGLSNTWPTYVGAPFQFALFVVLLNPDWQRHYLLIVFALAVVQWILPSDPRTPAAWMQAFVGVALTVQVRRATWLTERHVLALYCGGAAPFLLILGSGPPTVEWPWIHAWLAYQLVRVAALGWMAFVLVRRPHKEVADELGGARATGGRDGEPVARTRHGIADSYHDLGAPAAARSRIR